MGEGKRTCHRAPRDKGASGVHKGHFHIPAGMVVREGEEAVHMPTSLTYVTEKHSFLVKGAVAHLTLCIIRGDWQGRR